MNGPLLILLVNYFNEEETVSFIENQLLQQSGKNLQMVITNNGSHHPEKLTHLAAKHKSIMLVNSGNNSGYLRGAACGLDFYLNSGRQFPYAVIVSNSDLSFTDQNFFERLMNNVRSYPAGTSIIGPKIISTSTESDQNPFLKERISVTKLKFLRIIFSFYLFYIIYESLSRVKRKLFSIRMRSREDAARHEPVYAVHGSFIILLKNFFTSGTIHYPSFLFGEEIYLAEQARMQNQKVIYDSTLSLRHREHSSTGKLKSKTLVNHMKNSVNFLLQNYFSQ